MWNGMQVPSELFWRTKFFFPRAGVICLVKCDEGRFSRLAETVQFLKFKWEFVIIGRGCLVLLKFKSSLCWRMLCFKALLRLCSIRIKLPCVNVVILTSLRVDSQWIIILKKHSNERIPKLLSNLLFTYWICGYQLRCLSI